MVNYILRILSVSTKIRMVISINTENLKYFPKEYVCKEILNTFISYPEMKNFYLFEVIDLWFYVDHVNPKVSTF